MGDKVEQAVEGIKANSPVSDFVNSSMSRDEQLAFAQKLWQGGTDEQNKRCGEFTKTFGNLQITFESEGSKKVVQDIYNKSNGKDLYDTPAQQFVKSAAADLAPGDTLNGVNDKRSQISCEYASTQEKQTASAVVDKILSGGNVSQTLNELAPDARARVMNVVKYDLLDLSGPDKVEVSNKPGVSTDFDRPRFIDFHTKNGDRVYVEEDQLGTPKDIMANTKSWYYFGRSTKDVFDLPGQAEAREDADKREANAEKSRWLTGEPLTPKKGSIAQKIIDGETLTPEEYEKAKKYMIQK